MSFKFERQQIKDVILIKPKVFNDNRGFFMELYKESEFKQKGINDCFVQDNYSKSVKGVLRGLHYQLPEHGQAKLVRCIKGKIYDVAVDIRKDSSTFGQYVKVVLSEDNKQSLYIPVGFAHGFVALSDNVEVMYKTGSEYSSSSERGIIWNDKDLKIDWGIDFDPILSEKDKKLPSLKEVIL